MNILLVSGHTNLKGDSVANKTIIEEFCRLRPETEVSLLDELYPDFHIDVAAEQEKLVRADVIILQFPIFWYSQPSILHRWMEDTFLHGFAHGSKGKALVGKRLIASFTAGAPQEAYGEGGAEAFIMPPVQGTAALTGMTLLEPVITYGVSYTSRTDPAAIADMQERAKAHAARLAEVVSE